MRRISRKKGSLDERRLTKTLGEEGAPSVEVPSDLTMQVSLRPTGPDEAKVCCSCSKRSIRSLDENSISRATEI